MCWSAVSGVDEEEKRTRASEKLQVRKQVDAVHLPCNPFVDLSEGKTTSRKVITDIETAVPTLKSGCTGCGNTIGRRQRKRGLIQFE